MAERICLVDDCNRPLQARGLCHTHYEYRRRHGLIQTRPPEPVDVRFWMNVDRSEPEVCWEWRGTSFVGMGYGVFQAFDEQRAHRVAWVLTHGPIPKGMLVCHRCDNPPCCNPGHLFLGTDGDNMADMVAKGRNRNGGMSKTHCPKGHPLSGDNLYRYPATHRHPNGRRSCRICRREAMIIFKQRHQRGSSQ